MFRCMIKNLQTQKVYVRLIFKLNENIEIIFCILNYVHHKDINI